MLHTRIKLFSILNKVLSEQNQRKPSVFSASFNPGLIIVFSKYCNSTWVSPGKHVYVLVGFKGRFRQNRGVIIVNKFFKMLVFSVLYPDIFLYCWIGIGAQKMSPSF